MSRGPYLILAPFLVLFGVLFPYLISVSSQWTTGLFIGAIVFELVMVGLLLGLYDPFRFVNWLRLVAAVIFLGYVLYVIDMITSTNAALFGTSRSQPSLLNAVLGLIIWGCPSFMFAKNARKWLQETDEPHQMMLLATSNPHKIEEIEAILAPMGFHVVGLDSLDSIPPEPVEDGDTFEANAKLKAIGYAKATGQVCLADDSGLEVDALGGAPGVHSARYAGKGETRDERDAFNNEKLLRELDAIPDEHRAARFVCAMCLATPEGEILAETRGEFEGVISREPRGENGFGYDPLLYLPDVNCSSAELTPEDKNDRSHRGEAARQMAEKLHELEINF